MSTVRQFSIILASMSYIKRLIQPKIERAIANKKSILLLGPRQTGKTTILKHQINTDMHFSFLDAETRRRFESEPERLIKEIKAKITLNEVKEKPIVLLDEIQKVPSIMDNVQAAIDDKLATFILTGSSARKLKRDHKKMTVNLLPGRVISLHMDALSILEMENNIPEIEDLLLNGSLPEIILQTDKEYKEELLLSYVNLYLEEEIRLEAMVKNLASFSRFLTYAAVEAGNQISVNKLSEELGISRYVLTEYFQILQDCLIAEKIEPVTNSTTRRRLSKSPKYLFFDLGIRRVAAGEGLRLPEKYYGHLFEQFIGIELLKAIRVFAPNAKLRYWHDHAGPEVDYVIEYNHQFIPIEVNWTKNPDKKHAKHLKRFLTEYDCVMPAFVVCRTPEPMELDQDIIAINWRSLISKIQKILS